MRHTAALRGRLHRYAEPSLIDHAGHRVPWEAMMPNDIDAREKALRFAAGLKGLALVRTGDTFALAEFKMSGATLDEIAAYLDADDPAEDDLSQDRRRADLRALLKAEHVMLAELDTAPRQLNQPVNDRAATEAALTEIRRRISELSEIRETGASAQFARKP